MKRTNIEVAREIVIGYFQGLASQDKLNADGFVELSDLIFDKTNKILLEHLKALKNIFERAIEEIEGDNNVQTNSDNEI